MSRSNLSCYLCHDKSVGETKLSLSDILANQPFPGGKLFSIEPGTDLPGIYTEVFPKANPPLVIFVGHDALGKFPKGQGVTFWNDADPPTLHHFGERIGQTVIVCTQCCKLYDNSLGDKLHKEFDSRLARKYDFFCRSLFDNDLLCFDLEKLKKFIEDHGDSMLCDEWTSVLQEIEGVAPHSHMEKIKERLAPVIEAFVKSRVTNGTRLKIVS